DDACRAAALGAPEQFPRRAERKRPAMRYGAAFVLRDPEGRLLLRQRPPRGLLGDMSETPTSPWAENFDRAAWRDFAPAPARWRAAGSVKHVFTHFPHTLDIYRAELESAMAAPP